MQWGLPGDVPVPGDYDGDGQTDLAVYRPSSSPLWYVSLSSTDYTTNLVIQWGLSGDVPPEGSDVGASPRDLVLRGHP